MRDVDPEKWNSPADKAVAAIRRLNPTRKIIIGSTCRNSVNTLCKLKIYDDENILYTYCVWNYLSTPNDGNRFSLVGDDTRKILSDNLAEIIKGNV